MLPKPLKNKDFTGSRLLAAAPVARLRLTTALAAALAVTMLVALILALAAPAAAGVSAGDPAPDFFKPKLGGGVGALSDYPDQVVVLFLFGYG